MGAVVPIPPFEEALKDHAAGVLSPDQQHAFLQEWRLIAPTFLARVKEYDEKHLRASR